jgi:hypothetical protein
MAFVSFSGAHRRFARFAGLPGTVGGREADQTA